MLKSSSGIRRMEENVYSNISVQAVGQMTDGDLPNTNAVQMLLCTFYRSAYTCGMINERQSIAHLQPSKPLGLQARRHLQSTYCTVQYLENAMQLPGLHLMVV